MIRLRQTRNLAAVQYLNDQCLVNSELTPHQLEASTWWLASAQGLLAGFCGVKADYQEPMAYLIRAGVLPPYRGQGLQRHMIRTRLRWARARGLRYAVTDTTPDNCTSANNLIRCGLRLYQPEDAWAGYDGVLYWILEL